MLAFFCDLSSIPVLRQKKVFNSNNNLSLIWSLFPLISCLREGFVFPIEMKKSHGHRLGRESILSHSTQSLNMWLCLSILHPFLLLMFVFFFFYLFINRNWTISCKIQVKWLNLLNILKLQNFLKTQFFHLKLDIALPTLMDPIGVSSWGPL